MPVRLFMLAVLALGCAKAKAIPRAEGGFLLVTTARTIEQALTRFERTAHDRCGDGYTLGTPAVVQEGMSAGPLGGGTTVTVQSELTCTETRR